MRFDVGGEVKCVRRCCIGFVVMGSAMLERAVVESVIVVGSDGRWVGE